jgi:hypothetical protein
MSLAIPLINVVTDIEFQHSFGRKEASRVEEKKNEGRKIAMAKHCSANGPLARAVCVS